MLILLSPVDILMQTLSVKDTLMPIKMGTVLSMQGNSSSHIGKLPFPLGETPVPIRRNYYPLVGY